MGKRQTPPARAYNERRCKGQTNEMQVQLLQPPSNIGMTPGIGQGLPLLWLGPSLSWMGVALFDFL